MHTFQGGGEAEACQVRVLSCFSSSCPLRKPHPKLLPSLVLSMGTASGEQLLMSEDLEKPRPPLASSSGYFSLPLPPCFFLLQKFLLARSYFKVYSTEIWHYTAIQYRRDHTDIWERLTVEVQWFERFPSVELSKQWWVRPSPWELPGWFSHILASLRPVNSLSVEVGPRNLHFITSKPGLVDNHYLSDGNSTYVTVLSTYYVLCPIPPIDSK